MYVIVLLSMPEDSIYADVYIINCHDLHLCHFILLMSHRMRLTLRTSFIKPTAINPLHKPTVAGHNLQQDVSVGKGNVCCSGKC